MNITKLAPAIAAAELEPEELEAINRFAKTALRAEEVYTFSVILCDNEIDRDMERFDEATLEALAQLFVGKTGISDHRWESGRQVARIYRCEFMYEEGRKTSDGRDYACVKARVYMLRSQENAALIADIEGGIKRETSVGCAVAETRCSICGESLGSCGHEKGREYGGKLCHGVLCGAVDAYEWSFVAVPAQRGAGVTKAFGKDGESFDAGQEELIKLARLGRSYMKSLRAEVKRLGLICDRELYKNMDGAIEAMEPDALETMKAALEERAAAKLPLMTQLPGMAEVTRFDGGEYLV